MNRETLQQKECRREKCREILKQMEARKEAARDEQCRLNIEKLGYGPDFFAATGTSKGGDLLGAGAGRYALIAKAIEKQKAINFENALIESYFPSKK
jgi:hypothetical protein